MIKYQLICEASHSFEGWFPSSISFDEQKQKGLLSCPHCSSVKIEKALMAPNISLEKKIDPKALRAELLKDSRDVGSNFVSEARRLKQEDDSQKIHGKATLNDAVELAKEGIAVLPLPPLPEELN